MLINGITTIFHKRLKNVIIFYREIYYFQQKVKQIKMDLTCQNTIDCKHGAVRAVRFNVDGSYCITCGADKKLTLWNPFRSLALKTYAGHGNEVLDACGSCDSSQIVSCGADKSVIIWDVSTGVPQRRMRCHASSVTCVRFNEESTCAVSGSLDNSVMFWDIRARKNEPIQVLKEAKDSISSVEIAAHKVLVGALDCSVRQYDLRTGEVISDFVGEPVLCASFTRDAKGLVVGCSGDIVRLFDATTGELLTEYTGHKTGDFRVECGVNSEDNTIWSGASDGCVWCWDLVESTVIGKLEHCPGRIVNSLAAHPSHATLLTAAGSTIKLWSKKEFVDEEE